MKEKSARGTKPSKSKKAEAKAKQKRKEQSDKNVASLSIQSIDKPDFDPDFHPESFLQHCREGDTPTLTCGYWGISKRTLDRWVKLYPEMADAYAEGRTAFEAFWHHKIKNSIIDPKSHFKAFNFIWFSKNTMSWNDAGAHEFPGAAKEEFTFQDLSNQKLYAANGKEIKREEED